MPQSFLHVAVVCIVETLPGPNAGPLVLNRGVDLQNREELVPRQISTSLVNQSSLDLRGTQERDAGVECEAALWPPSPPRDAHASPKRDC